MDIKLKLPLYVCNDDFTAIEKFNIPIFLLDSFYNCHSSSINDEHVLTIEKLPGNRKKNTFVGQTFL